MTDANLPPDDQSPDEPATSPTRGHIKWELTTEALNKLLNCFSEHPEEAAELLLAMRQRLMRFFEWNGCNSAEDLVDETINRVARRIEEGEKIENLKGYFRKVALHVLQEWQRRPIPGPLDELPETPQPEPVDEEKESRLQCLDQCLEKLTIQNRKLILEYYQDERRVKIDHRKNLAETFGIQLNALRIRAHRIRSVLEKCVQNCFAQTGLSGNKTEFNTL